MARSWPAGHPTLQAALVMAGLLSIFFFDILFLGKTLQVSRTTPTVYLWGPHGVPGPPPSSIPISDNTPAVQEEPYLAFKRHELAAGRFPLWNPHQAAGLPFAANPQATLFLPEIPLYVLPTAYAWDLFLLLKLFAAGLFTYLFLRLIGCSQVAALGGGAAYMLCGPLITWLNNAMTNVDCLLPLLLFGIERLLRADRPWALPLAALAVALTILGGHPEHTFFAHLTGLIYVIYRIWTGDSRLRSWRCVWQLGAAYLLGLGVAAVLLLPFSEFFLGPGWSYHSTTVGLETEDVPSRAVTILVPYLFQSELVTTDFRHAGWWGGYLGAATLLLALLGIARSSPLRVGILFGGMLIVALGKCYSVPGINLLGALPLFNRIRISFHLTQTVAFLAAVLVGIALNLIGKRQVVARQAAWFALALSVVALGFVFYHLPGLSPTRAVPALLPAALVLILIPGLLLLMERDLLTPPRTVLALLVLLVGELFIYQPRDHPARYDPFDEAPYIRWLKDQPERGRVFGIAGILYPNTATAFQIDDLGILEGLHVGRFVRFARTLIDPALFPEDWRGAVLRGRLPDYTSPFLDLLNVRYLLVPQSTRVSSLPPSIELVYDADVKILRRTHALPRAYTVTHWRPVRTEQEALAALRAGHDFRSSVLLEVSSESLGDPEEPGRRQPALRATIVRYTPNRVVIEATTERPSVLVLADTYYPGWEATVDGQPASVWPANALLRGVPLQTPGRHVIEFRFRPRSVLIGGGVSLISLAILVGLWWLTQRRMRRKLGATAEA
jgi:hypothetical protein